MTLYFSKTEFNKHADMSCKRALSGHLDVLDGMEVEQNINKLFEIPHYVVDGEVFYLYPVLREWCTEQKQGSLFE